VNPTLLPHIDPTVPWIGKIFLLVYMENFFGLLYDVWDVLLMLAVVIDMGD
jgi:hypothetical protein